MTQPSNKTRENEKSLLDDLCYLERKASELYGDLGILCSIFLVEDGFEIRMTIPRTDTRDSLNNRKVVCWAQFEAYRGDRRMLIDDIIQENAHWLQKENQRRMAPPASGQYSGNIFHGGDVSYRRSACFEASCVPADGAGDL